MEEQKTREILKSNILTTINAQSSINQRTSVLMEALVQQYGISHSAFRVMRLVCRSAEGIEPSVIAQKTAMLRQTVTNIVDALEGDGLAARRTHPTDRRRVLVYPTEEGRRKTEEVLTLTKEIYDRVFARFTTEEMKTYIELRVKITSYMQEEIENSTGIRK